jgi:peptidoglycan/xylan/chitin deacetylase (PgdA/CDA1 family)
LKPLAITFDDGWDNQYTYAFPLLTKYHDVATFYLFTNPIGKVEHYLTWEQLKDMQAAGNVVGSHTVMHPYLNKLTPDELMHELTASKATIEEHLGTPVVHFAYPFGYHDQTVEAALATAGYATGRTLDKHVVQTDPLALGGVLATSNPNSVKYALERYER